MLRVVITDCAQNNNEEVYYAFEAIRAHVKSSQNIQLLFILLFQMTTKLHILLSIDLSHVVRTDECGWDGFTPHNQTS